MYLLLLWKQICCSQESPYSGATQQPIQSRIFITIIRAESKPEGGQHQVFKLKYFEAWQILNTTDPKKSSSGVLSHRELVVIRLVLLNKEPWGFRTQQILHYSQQVKQWVFVNQRTGYWPNSNLIALKNNQTSSLTFPVSKTGLQQVNSGKTSNQRRYSPDAQLYLF